MPRILLTEEQKKANKKASNKKYRDNNKEQVKASNKKWRDNNNKEDIKINNKKWRDDNKEKLKEYYEERKEKIKEYQQTPKRRRFSRIKNWKSKDMIEPEEGWEAFMDRVENTKNCDLCGIELTEDRHPTSTTRCVDHSHITHLFRNIVCNGCNIRLPRGT